MKTKQRPWSYVFKADSKQKRIGKGNAIRCMEVDMKQFEEDEPPEEILEFDKEEDIVWYIKFMDHLEQVRLTD